MSVHAQPERPRPVTTFTSEDKGIGPVRFSPDGKTLAIVAGDGLVLWEAATRQVRARLEAPGLIPLGSVAFTPDGKGLTTGGGSRPRLWDLTTGKPRVLPARREGVTECIALSPDGKILARGNEKGTVELWDPAAVKELGILKCKGMIFRMEFSPDGKTLAATGGTDGGKPVGRLWLWDVAGRRLRTTIECEAKTTSLAFSPDGQTLAVDSGGIVQLRDSASGRLRASWKFGPYLAWALAFSSDGRVLVAGGGEESDPAFPLLTKGSGEVKFWDVTAEKEILAFRAHEECVYWMALSPDGKLLAVSTGKPGLPMKLWDVSAITARKPAGPGGK